MDNDDLNDMIQSTRTSSTGNNNNNNNNMADNIIKDLSSQIRSPSASNGQASNMKDDQVQFQKLQKLNFDMKLRIFYLEERLAKLAPGNSQPNMVALEEDLFQQRMLCEEKTNELEERNILLIKARNAIESLQADLELAKAESEEMRNDNSHPLVRQKEMELSMSKNVLEDKEKIIISQNNKINEMETKIEELTVHVNNGVDQAAESKLLEVQHVKVNNENAVLQEKIANLNAQNENLNKQLLILKDTAESHIALSNEMIEKDKELMDYKSKHDDINTEITNLTQKVEELNLININLKKSNEESQMAEAEEISRLENELNDAIMYSDKNVAEIEKNKMELLKTKQLLKETTRELKELDIKFSEAKTENRTLLESMQIKETKLQAIATEKEATLKQQHLQVVIEKERRLAEMDGKYKALEFNNTDLKRKLENEEEDSRRCRHIIDDMKQRIEEMEDSRRREEHKRIKFLEDQAVVKDKLDGRINILNEEINKVKANKIAEMEIIRRENHDRESKWRQESIQWEKLIQAHLNECFNPGSGDPSTLSLEEEIKRQEIEQSTQMSETGTSLNNIYPRRHIIQQLGQIRRLRSAFSQTVRHAEVKYLGKLERMETELKSKEKEIRKLNDKVRILSKKVVDTAKLQTTISIVEADRKDEREQLKREVMLKTRLESQVEQLKGEMTQTKHLYKEKNERLKQFEHKFEELNIKAHEINRIKHELVQTKNENVKLKEMTSGLQSARQEDAIENSRLKDAIEVAQKEMKTLYHTQTKLHQQINDRDHELKRYSHELHGHLTNNHLLQNQQHGQDGSRYHMDIRMNRRSHNQHGYSNAGNGESHLGLSARDIIMKQVEDTHDLIRNSQTTLETERRRYQASSFAANSPLRHNRSLDIGHLDDHNITDVNDHFKQHFNQQQHRSIHGSPPRSSKHSDLNETERFNLERELNQKYSSLQDLMKQIEELVLKSGTFLENFLNIQDGKKSTTGNVSTGTIQTLSDYVMSLLDSNARLALQLQNLGHDLQKVYRRFKALETNLHSNKAHINGNGE